ncbi:MAG: YjjW family glycine radical enzyme activase [Eubacteriales bacterium]|nr:YjjW family glycine radical enzyme activase [Eubacteriales bacterium]
MKEKVPVNKIIPFSAVDGPGNRTAVFLQGCNFNCLYCHNPETRNLCRNCGACIQGCPGQALSMQEGQVRFQPERCLSCDACIRGCPYGSSPRIWYLDRDQVFDRIKKQMPYIRGVTVSGGECTLYPEFLQSLFEKCREEGLGTLLDSNGTLDFSLYPQLLEVTDGVMLDVKAWGREDHRRVTGEDNGLVLKNLRTLAERGKLYEIRTVVVPGLFDFRETVREAAALGAKYLDRGDIRYKLISYRPMGVRREYAHFPVPEAGQMEELAGIVREAGIRDIRIL